MILVKSLFDRNFLLFAIFVLGFALRIVGTNPGYLNHPDEPKIADAALDITFKLNFEPVAFYYGSLLPVVYALINFVFVLPIYILLYLPLNFIISLLQGNPGIVNCVLQNGFSTCALSESKDFFSYLTRYETAFLSSVSIVLIYFLCKKLFNKPGSTFGKTVGLFTAFFTAINYRHVLSSHFSLADAPLIVFIIISVLLSFKIIEKSSTKNYLLAGIGLGLVLSVKYFIYTIPTLFLCHIMASLNNINKLQTLLNSKLLLSILIAILTFSIINPYVYLDYKNAKEQFDLNSMFYKTKDISLYSFINFAKIPLFSIYYLFKYGLGEIMSIATFIGFIISLIKYTKPTLILSSIIFPFLYIFLVISGTTFVRNYSAIIPLLLIFPAILLSQLLKPRSKISLIITFILVLTISFTSFKSSLLLSYSLSQPKNQDLFLDWVVDNIPNDAVLAHSIDVPVPSYKPDTVISWTHWPTSYMSLDELKSKNIEWVAISSEATTFISEQLWTGKRDIIKRSFLNKGFLDEYLKNTYPSLLIHELGDYRVKEFFKSYQQSPDSSIFISKIPSLTIEEGTLIVNYDFDKETDLKSWSNSSIQGESLHKYLLSDNGERKRMEITQKNLCPNLPIQYSTAFTKISSKSFNVHPSKWYILSAIGQREALSKYTAIRNGFVRLDFYTKDGLWLKSYVSGQLSEKGALENMTAFGMAPTSSAYAKASFQLDYCNEGEKYFLDSLKISEVKNQPVISFNEYPFYGEPLPDNFTWQPPL